MVGLGMLLILVTLLASYLRWRGTLFSRRWLLWIFVFAVIGPFAANQLGWVAAEIGRQPWVVHPRVLRDDAGNIVYDQAGLIRYRMEEGLLTREGISETIIPGPVVGSIAMFGFIYGLLFWIWLYVLNDKIQKGPLPLMPPGRTTGPGIISAAAGRTIHQDTMSGAKDVPDRQGRED
jgi:cytochrome d ubiquinol oxidase subunit I